ncbi:MAG: nucleotidyltransferase domain-containing protein [Prevotella sp.]|nr:nucleotidyltransferase domain-containing protein [Prevotella sp.]
MMYGLKDDELKLLRETFEKTPNLQKVILYGSRAKGNYRPFSDVDVTLIGEHLTNDDLADVAFRLSESSLPYFCDVSLFSKLQNPALIDHIKRRGKAIYIA